MNHERGPWQGRHNKQQGSSSSSSSLRSHSLSLILRYRSSSSHLPYRSWCVVAQLFITCTNPDSYFLILEITELAALIRSITVHCCILYHIDYTEGTVVRVLADRETASSDLGHRDFAICFCILPFSIFQGNIIHGCLSIFHGRFIRGGDCSKLKPHLRHHRHCPARGHTG